MTRRSDAATTAVVLVIVAVLGVGGIVVLSRGHRGPSHPSEWDPRVLDIVQFDEEHRGLKFEHPVYVDFLDPAAYSQRARTDQSELTDKEKQQLEAENGELRALGLSNSNIDLLQAQNDLQDTGTLAFYDPDSQHVIVRGTDITVALKVTLVHEFVHVLQDQHFGVGRSRTSQFTTSQEESSFRALVEGDAVRIENEYIMSLSEADRQAYQTTHSKEVDNATSGLSNVPVALQALQSAPYLLGPPFDELLIAKGEQAELDAAFKNPPSTDEHLLDPPKFEDKQGPAHVDEPKLPDGVRDSDKVDSGDFGALGLFLVLGERTDPLAALQASDGWGGDAYVAYQQNGKTCVRIDMRGDTETDINELRNAFDQWTKVMPAGAASLTSNGDVLELQTCDPGANSDLVLNNRANDLVQMPAARSQFMLEAVEQLHFSFDAAFTFGDCVVHNLGFDLFVEADKAGGSALTPELQQKIQSAITACR